MPSFQTISRLIDYGLWVWVASFYAPFCFAISRWRVNLLVFHLMSKTFNILSRTEMDDYLIESISSVRGGRIRSGRPSLKLQCKISSWSYKATIIDKKRETKCYKSLRPCSSTLKLYLKKKMFLRVSALSVFIFIYGAIHTKIDLSWIDLRSMAQFALRKCSHLFRSISVRI